ncbi:MAG: hypothetical protein ACOCTI_00955 [Phycisphaeraceae bacterium]
MRILLCLLLTLAFTPAALAQGLEPVDQAVEDLDPLARSQRRVEQDNARFSPRVRLFKLERRDLFRPQRLITTDPTSGLKLPRQYRYEGPGVRAWMSRPSYVVSADNPAGVDFNVAPRRDGEFREIAAPGIVYDLIPRSQNTRRELPEDDNPWRVNGRIPGRIDTRVGNVDHTVTDRIQR